MACITFELLITVKTQFAKYLRSQFAKYLKKLRSYPVVIKLLKIGVNIQYLKRVGKAHNFQYSACFVPENGSRDVMQYFSTIYVSKAFKGCIDFSSIIWSLLAFVYA